jgi:hypothetical protein
MTVCEAHVLAHWLTGNYQDLLLQDQPELLEDLPLA